MAEQVLLQIGLMALGVVANAIGAPLLRVHARRRGWFRWNPKALAGGNVGGSATL